MCVFRAYLCVNKVKDPALAERNAILMAGSR